MMFWIGGLEMWAHSVNSTGVRHHLVDHLEGTASLAERFASVFGAGPAGRFLGLAHDTGKASCAWQQRLLLAESTGGRVGFEHKSLGVLLARRRGAAALGLPLHGHHGGLTSPAFVDTEVNNAPAEHARARLEAEAALRPLLPALFEGPQVPLPPGFSVKVELDMLLRLLYSALVDADGLDTAAHRAGGQAHVTPPADMAMLWDRFVRRRERMLAGRGASTVDKWREEVFHACVAAASGPGGFFRLPAPTGSGKTIAAGAFGLRHALEHGKSRVIVAVPFITITEQNAAVYRQLLDPDGPGGGDPVVLEHHSQVRLGEDGPGPWWARLAAENWDAPFVVTTTVQLFESLFGRRPAAMRKVHRLANAVIVLDEVQALPAPLLVPIVHGLRQLTNRFGTTVLLASATQPDLWSLNPLKNTQPTEIINEPQRLYDALRRVRYEWWTDPKPSLEQVAERVSAPNPSGHDQILTIMNTIGSARRMWELLREQVAADMSVFHLSTAMCPAHRRDVLTEVRDLLADGKPVRLVSTQLIEAGVDVDFPTVYRAMAPADSLQQAAGRANREGVLGQAGGRVVVFDPDEVGSPPSYTLPVRLTRERIGPGSADPDDLKALRDYYRSYFGQPPVKGPESRGYAVQAARGSLDFHTVTEGPRRVDGREGRDRSRAFRMIEDDTVPIVVPYEPAQQVIDDLVAELRASPRPEPELFRQLQPYLAMVKRRTRERADVAALCRPLVGDLVEWVGTYDGAGLVLTPTGEDFIA
ncbi:CRISPR-associated helicase Cas3' [Frankia sp. AiPs1]